MIIFLYQNVTNIGMKGFCYVCKFVVHAVDIINLFTTLTYPARLSPLFFSFCTQFFDTKGDQIIT